MTGTNANRTVALGNSAGVSGTASTDNVLVGYGAGSYANSTGNTMIGNKAGFRTNGNYNTVLGYRALSGSSSGDTSHLNVAIGYTAMEDSTSAQENVAIGSYAGGDLTTGDYNVLIGNQSGTNAADAQNRVAIGYGCEAVADNSVTLGNADVDHVYMAQDSGAEVHAALYKSIREGHS